MSNLISVVDLPRGFTYPPEFLRVVELGLTNIEPWWIMDGEALFRRHIGLRSRYPDDCFVPFAERQDNDDVACWDLDSGGITVVHDFASPGYHRENEFASFNAWFRQAVEDFIEWGE
ncbi:conserved hypothetical protein [Frankia canadensis]|uniref:SMI1/KNR4 family protein n=1 Tax=Frankia canadensis TaxID=1836972 RepID=A0A2I2KN63_9ACTN|nr:hypothetical protein [Frankia canadensis]SNQ47111.1 conserved hypothetical protein [Frankia canadensis]SOU54401.1 conserved hypothetical protein [Frankia canadensis]